MYYFTHVIGSFLTNEQGEITDEGLCTKTSTTEECEQKIRQKHPTSKPLPETKLNILLVQLKDPKYRSLFYPPNRKLVEHDIKNSVNQDNIVIQSVGLLEEIDKAANILVKRLREWHALTFPEFEDIIQDHFFYAKLISEKTNEQIAAELNIKNILGKELPSSDEAAIKLLAVQVVNLYKLRENNEKYLSEIMHAYCPNLSELGGATIAAKLLNHARSLKHLAMLPASTIQLFGAEKALFRHIKTGARSPKYGLIINHPIVQNAKREEKGKAARLLADKLSLCARLDYFKGELKAAEYKKAIEAKLCPK